MGVVVHSGRRPCASIRLGSAVGLRGQHHRPLRMPAAGDLPFGMGHLRAFHPDAGSPSPPSARRSTEHPRTERNPPSPHPARSGSVAARRHTAAAAPGRRCPAAPSVPCRRAPHPLGRSDFGAILTLTAVARRSAIGASAIAWLPPTGTGQPDVCASVASSSPAPAPPATASWRWCAPRRR